MSAIDELGMATERLRVRLPDEPKPKLLHIIEPHEVSWREAGNFTINMNKGEKKEHLTEKQL